MEDDRQIQAYRNLERIADALEDIVRIVKRDVGEGSDVREEIARVRVENNALRAELEQLKARDIKRSVDDA